MKERNRQWRKNNPDKYREQVNKEANRAKSRRQYDEEYRLSINEATKAHYHKVKHEYRAKFMVRTAKRRAKTLGLDFNLEESDIVIPEVCPILGIPLVLNEGKPCAASASLDRLDSSKGYIKGNVWVISHKANAMKNNATLEELKLFADWVNREAALLWIQREHMINYNGEQINVNDGSIGTNSDPCSGTESQEESRSFPN